MDNKLVSIIIPVYKVEEYLHECIDAVLKQTYKNLQIILVDDGSPDSCGLICDQYKINDPRIEVIHKENGGLSSARNRGLELAQGEYISFIDSDDYVSPVFIEELVNAAEEYNSDVVCVDYTTEEQKLSCSKHSQSLILNTNDAISMLLNPTGYRCFAWNKLYKKYLFENIRYPEGRLYEDIVTTYELFKFCNKIVYINSPYYYYRVRESSISTSDFSDRNYDLLYAINVVDKSCKKSFPDAYKELHIGFLTYYLAFINQMIVSRKVDQDSEKELQRDIFRSFKNMLTSNNIPLKRKIEFSVFAMNPQLYRKIYLLTKGY